MSRAHPSLAFRNVTTAVLLGSAYFVIAALVVRYTRFEGGVAFIWGSTALLLADLVPRPKVEWPLRIACCAVGGAAATIFFGLGPAAALPFAVVNVAEATLGAVLLRRFLPKCCHFDSLGEIFGFLFIAGVVAPAVCGTLAATIAHEVAGVPFFDNWLAYLAGHALGVVTLTPIFMLSSAGDMKGWIRKATTHQWWEAICLLGLMILTSVLVFSQTRYPLLFLPFLPMSIAIFRLGRLGAAASLLLLTMISITLTIKGFGPVSLIQGADGLRAQFLQLYLATAVLLALPAAAELKRRKQVMTQLQQTSALARLILDRTSDIIINLDVGGNIRYVSPSILSIGGHDPAALVGRSPRELIHSEDLAEVTRVHGLSLSAPDETFIVEYRARRADGTEGWFESHMRATVDEAGQATGSVSVIREVTGRKAQVEELTHEAATDPLTGLINRREFDRALQLQLAETEDKREQSCLAMFDLDHFKSVNDRFGHATGDMVLRSFAQLLQSTLRKHDVIARYGGEEFIVILNRVDLEQARLVCERVRQRFAASACRADDGRDVRATVSVGLAVLAPGMSSRAAFRSADDALYRAKTSGRNRLVLAA